MKTYTKESLIQSLREIRDMGWIKNRRQGNSGGIGNTIEDLLGIEENNLPIPNAAEWELKAQRIDTTSLLTLFHMEPSPTACKFIPQVLLPRFGWPHKEAGLKYGPDEMSFRQTINAVQYSDRGFKVRVDNRERKIAVDFDMSRIDERHSIWRQGVLRKIGPNGLSPYPYWGFDDLFHKVGTKLHNCFYLGARMKKEGGEEYFHYTQIMMLKDLSQEKFIKAVEEGAVYIDFDARTGHNHGTKFRVKQSAIPSLYSEMKVL
jgi:hypothetical protein